MGWGGEGGIEEPSQKWGKVRGREDHKTTKVFRQIFFGDFVSQKLARIECPPDFFLQQLRKKRISHWAQMKRKSETRNWPTGVHAHSFYISTQKLDWWQGGLKGRERKREREREREMRSGTLRRIYLYLPFPVCDLFEPVTAAISFFFPSCARRGQKWKSTWVWNTFNLWAVSNSKMQ